VDSTTINEIGAVASYALACAMCILHGALLVENETVSAPHARRWLRCILWLSTIVWIVMLAPR
jgi:hypothetical protein